MTIYSNRSPYFDTKKFGDFLDVMVNRPIPADSTDTLITISSTYHQRPDLLAFDLYDDSRLWWVFAMRNPEVLEDSIFDFTSGTQIYISAADTVLTAIGV
jgi:hypothetical protein